MIDINNLSEEEKQQLKERLQEEDRFKEEQRKKEIESYKRLVNETVLSCLKELKEASSTLATTKVNVYNSFATLVDMKKELFGYKSEQRSHTFTSEDGQSIIIGNRTTDGWDDTIEAGIFKINDFMDSLATSDETAKLVKIINSLLKKDAKGNLKANRVLDLQNLADEINNPVFSEGVEIIRAAYKPSRSAFFIEATSKDELGKNRNVPLSITSVDFPEGTNLNWGV